MLIEFLGALFRGCARVSLSIFDREKIHLTGNIYLTENIFPAIFSKCVVHFLFVWDFSFRLYADSNDNKKLEILRFMGYFS